MISCSIVLHSVVVKIADVCARVKVFLVWDLILNVLVDHVISFTRVFVLPGSLLSILNRVDNVALFRAW